MTYPNLTAQQVAMIREFFAFADLNNDGFISVNELLKACAVDIDGDGETTESEKSFFAAPLILEYHLEGLNDKDRQISLDDLLRMNDTFWGDKKNATK